MPEEEKVKMRGRGAQINPANRFESVQTARMEAVAIDDWTETDSHTQYLEQDAKSLVNKVESPDVNMFYSMNPYQGCEHGCIYCYARNSHEYWGFSAGLDFERKIIVKRNAPELLRKFLVRPDWECQPLSISGNTDCYQPAEQRFRITRRLIEVCQEFNQPIGIITKNAGILRDADLLVKMAERRLASVLVSINSLDESIRRKMEPRTTTNEQRLKVIRELSAKNVHTGVMLGPVIPGLNDHEIPQILERAAAAGARFAAYTFVRLNGAVKLIFHEWLYREFPDRADKVWHAIEHGHGGKVNDSRFGTRMRGEGPQAAIIRQQFKKFSQLYGLNSERWSLDTSLFSLPGKQLKLF
ncbi:PA0069 family radical SAM protein [Flavihumibacter sp. CACIAM 22H1]|uniref:PA0069 family radical SAM protein n=1 Tax=Flavihumibacter sp. CACIAM 22H1 TaxID=1812911 RepID=UPI0007A850F0|nr:PA0069 family radical SAM protein [Flavihumibacter sp. CACIAM 22H1]KYP13165.1 MAG: radical SAM protein [Flavihumibacter sp. CACIAM 22H1]